MHLIDSAAGDVPLCVDLDGTLVATDVFVESLVALLARAPWLLLQLPWWLLQGRAALKREVLHRSPVDPAHLPYRVDILGVAQGASKRRTLDLLSPPAADDVRRARSRPLRRLLCRRHCERRPAQPHRQAKGGGPLRAFRRARL